MIFRKAWLLIRCACHLHLTRFNECEETEGDVVVSREVYCGKCLRGFMLQKPV